MSLDENNIDISNRFIQHISIKNYKSIKQLDINLTNLNVLIGANGAGKSNFISFFALLQQMLKQNLSGYVMNKGGQDVFLYYGRQKSDYLSAKIDFALNSYEFVLSPTNENVFRVKYEDIKNNDGINLSLSDMREHSGYESSLDEKYIDDKYRSLILDIKNNLLKLQVFHFHDTSDKSALKSTVVNNDNLYLRSDGGNLAAMIKFIHDKFTDYYNLIVDTIQLVIPDFHDFVIRDNEFITLEWFNKNNVDIPWKAHYLSDGSLRFIALATLLLMPRQLQPETIIIDEPELGLHPAAINVLSGLIKRAAQERQIIISTQSSALLANLEPENIIVVDKKDDYSKFKRLNKHDLASWLHDFSLPELWDMNILGGRP